MSPLERASSSGSAESLNGSQHSASSSLDDELKTAKRICFGNLVALLDFLKVHGVSRSTIHEMNLNLQNNKYLIVLQRAQEYCKLWELESQVLLLSSWQSMERYAQLSYKQTYHRYHSQRTTSRASEIQNILSRQVKLAEICCLCQKEVILVQRRHQQ